MSTIFLSAFAMATVIPIGSRPFSSNLSCTAFKTSRCFAIASLAVATYPSLTELSYVKGVTSAIQTQLDSKQATISFGTGVETALGVNVGSAGAFITFN